MARQEDSEAGLASLTKLFSAFRVLGCPSIPTPPVRDTTLKGNFYIFSVSKYQTLHKAAGHAAMAFLSPCHQLQVRAGINIAGWHEAKQLNSPKCDWRSAGGQTGKGLYRKLQFWRVGGM